MFFSCQIATQPIKALIGKVFRRDRTVTSQAAAQYGSTAPGVRIVRRPMNSFPGATGSEFSCREPIRYVRERQYGRKCGEAISYRPRTGPDTDLTRRARTSRHNLRGVCAACPNRDFHRSERAIRKMYFRPALMVHKRTFENVNRPRALIAPDSAPPCTAPSRAPEYLSSGKCPHLHLPLGLPKRRISPMLARRGAHIQWQKKCLSTPPIPRRPASLSFVETA
jgi:hypothetical protein